MIDATKLAVINEKFPHIAKNISFLWGYKELNDYMNRLFTDTRGGKRQGFSFEIVTVLMELLEQHKREYPQFNFKEEVFGIYEKESRTRYR